MSNIRVELQLEDGSFTTGIWRAGRNLKQFKEELKAANPEFKRLSDAGQGSILHVRSLSNETESFTRRLRNLSLGIGAATVGIAALGGASNGIVGSIIRVNAEMERLRYQMAAMSDAADPMLDAAKSVEFLRDMATTTPFAVSVLANSFVKLKAAGIDPMNGSLKAVTDAIAAFGGSDEQLNRVTVALTQMQGKGVLSMEELRQQLGESMPTAMKLMARSMGVSIGELTQFVSTGTVESKAALEKWFREVSLTYGGSGELMMQTFSGQIAKINTQFNELATNGALKDSFDRLKGLMGDFGDWLKTDSATRFFTTVGDGFNSLMDLGQLAVSAFQALEGTIQRLVPLMPLIFGGIAVAGAARALGGAIQATRRSLVNIRTDLSNTSLAFKTMGSDAKNAGLMVGQAVGMAAGAATTSLTQTTTTLLGTVGSFVSSLTKGVLRAIPIIGGVYLAVTELVPLLFDGAKAIWGWATGAKQASDAIEQVGVAGLQNAREQFEAKEKLLMQQIEAQEARVARYLETTGKDSPGHQRGLEALWDRLIKLREDFAADAKKFSQEEGQFLVEKANSAIKASLQPVSREYDAAMTVADKRRDERMAAAAKSGESEAKITSDYHADATAARTARYEAEIKMYDAEIEKARQYKDSITGNSAASLLIEQRDKLVEAMNQSATTPMTVDFLTAPESEEKMAKRLNTRIKRSTDSISEMMAELNGASGAVAKLMYQIKRGDFGKLNNGVEATAALRDLLIESTVAAEALDAVLKQSEKDTKEITSIYDKLRSENFELEAKIAGIDPDDELAYYNFLKSQGEIGKSAEEMVDEALATVTKGINVTIGHLDNLGGVLRNNAFGDDSVRHIDDVGAALGRVQDVIADVRNGIYGVDFSNLGGPKGFSLNANANVSGGLLDLIASVEAGPAGYNATLDNGKYTNGSQDLVSMTLKEVLALQRQMLTNPANKKNSSALGRYQIVGTTLGGKNRDGKGGLMAELGLTGDELFDEQMQDRLALHLAGKRGNDPAGLTKEWQGLQGVSAEDIAAAYARTFGGPLLGKPVPAPTAVTAEPQAAKSSDASVVGPQARSQMIAAAEAAQATREAKEAEAKAADAKNKELQARYQVSKLEKDFNEQMKTYGLDGDKAGKAESRVLEAIEARKFGNQDTTAILKLARELDAAEAKSLERKKDARELERSSLNVSEKEIELIREQEELAVKLKNHNEVVQSSKIQKLRQEQAETLETVARLHGKDSDQYKQYEQKYTGLIGLQAQIEGTEALIKLEDAARDAEQAAIVDENVARRALFNERLNEITAIRDHAIRSGYDAAETQKVYDRAVAAERAKLARDLKTPLENQIEVMAAYDKRINEGTANWASSLSDNLYQMATKQTNSFQAFGNAVRESVARSLTDAAAASIMKPFENLIGGDGQEGSGIGGLIKKSINGLGGSTGGLFDGLFSGLRASLKSAFSGFGGWFKSLFGGLFGVMHTGGIVGSGSVATRSANASVFAGAKKFHTGGIIGGVGAPKGLLPSEVPIIAQRGEGVFTKEQMKRLGGSVNSQSININSPITVNASGGAPEQNADLARQMSREYEGMMRGIIQNELVRQSRPGGMIKR